VVMHHRCGRLTRRRARPCGRAKGGNLPAAAISGRCQGVRRPGTQRHLCSDKLVFHRQICPQHRSCVPGRRGGGLAYGHSLVTAGHRGRRPRVTAGSASRESARRSRSGLSDREIVDSASCGRATSDDFAARPSRPCCTLGRKNRRRWQPRETPRGETASSLRQPQRSQARRHRLLRGAVFDNVGTTAAERSGPPGPNIVKGGTRGERARE
jgi:hypothetical protein